MVVGSPWLEAEDAFDAALGEHRRHQVSANVTGHRDRLDLPSLSDIAPLGQYLGQKSLGEKSIAVRRIVGSAEATSQLFDRAFRPVDERARSRFQSVDRDAHREQLPPIDVYRWHGDYFVADGLHRVAAARAMRQDYITADVTDLVGGPQT